MSCDYPDNYMAIYLIISLDFVFIVRREQMKWIRNSTDEVYVSMCFFVSVCLSTKFQWHPIQNY